MLVMQGVKFILGDSTIEICSIHVNGSDTWVL